MKYKIIVLVVLASLACSTSKPRYVDYGSVRLKLYEFKDLQPPRKGDQYTAQHLSGDLRNKVQSALLKYGFIRHNKGGVAAARFYHGYLLLEVDAEPEEYDSNLFLVYSIRKSDIVGTFVWYIQG